MRKTILILSLIIMSGCGVQASNTGIYVDQSYSEHLSSQFTLTKACTGLPQGNFEDLLIIVMPQSFPCMEGKSLCAGQFRTPNIVKLGDVWSWNHEVVHYLLYENSGDLDPSHTSTLFRECGVPQRESKK